MKITYLKRINHTKYGLKTKSLDEIICTIRNGNLILHDNKYGDYTLKQIIDFFRSTNPIDLQDLKYRFLPAVAYNGTFSEISSNGLTGYSWITALDFDHIDNYDDLVHLRNRLIKTSCVKCVFTTPSGHGLKAIVLHDNKDPQFHRDLYEQLLNKFDVASKDLSCKDIARRNYLSYDPDIWVNNNAIPYHYIPSIKDVQDNEQTGIHIKRRFSDKSIISIMNSTWKKNNPEYWYVGNRANSIFRLACLMCKWGIDESLAEEYFVSHWEDDTMSRNEILGHVGRAYKREYGNFGTLDFKILK